MRTRSSTTLGSIISALCLAGLLILTGCSDSLTGFNAESDDITVQQQAQHNQNANASDDGSDGGSTNPRAGHNTTDED